MGGYHNDGTNFQWGATNETWIIDLMNNNFTLVASGVSDFGFVQEGSAFHIEGYANQCQ